MKLLFICTHNRCRSILAEAITNHLASLHNKTLEARSAGSQPEGQVHPLSIKYLKQAGISTQNLKSQSWDEFEEWNADVVITVCDSAAGESCPIWFGRHIQVHWGLPDPSKLGQGSQNIEETDTAFHAVIDTLTARILEILKHDLNALTDDEVSLLFNTIAAI